MAWITRGLRNGVLTSGYPRRPDPYADEFIGGVEVRTPDSQDRSRADADPTSRQLDRRPLQPCPTGAIRWSPSGRPEIDRGRCVLCGRCVEEQPDRFVWQRGSEVAVTDRRELLTTDAGDPSAGPDRPGADDVAAVRKALADRTRRFRRSLMIRHIDLGSDGSEEWEIAALLNPVYDIHRLGLYFTTSPRHADLLMITGAGSRAMLAPLRRTIEATARPYIVMAVGTDAISGGMITPVSSDTSLGQGPITGSATYAVLRGGSAMLPVDVWVPGSPPSPFMILSGLLLAVGRLPGHDSGQSGKRS